VTKSVTEKNAGAVEELDSVIYYRVFSNKKPSEEGFKNTGMGTI